MAFDAGQNGSDIENTNNESVQAAGRTSSTTIATKRNQRSHTQITPSDASQAGK